MKKLLSLFLLSLTSFTLQAVEWQEDVHYEVIADKASAKPQVMEFFSFWCPACNAVEPIVKQMQSRLEAEGVRFDKVHVNFMHFATPETQEAATRAMMIGKVLKREGELNQAIFDRIHKQRGHIVSEQDLQAVFSASGVSTEEYGKMRDSFGVNSLTAKNNKWIDEYRSKLTRGVPAFIVNGKYRATFTRDMTPDQVIELVVWLAGQK